MTTNDYSTLIQEFSQLIGLPDKADQIRACGTLVFKDVALTIFFDAAQTLVHVFVDFGEPPAHRTLDVLRRLLEINLLLSPDGSPRLGLDPGSGRVIFTHARPLRDLTAQKLLGGIDMGVRQAAAWRESFFLDEQAGTAQLRDALMV